MGGRKEGNIEWVRVRASCLKAKWSESEKWPETSYTRKYIPQWLLCAARAGSILLVNFGGKNETCHSRARVFFPEPNSSWFFLFSNINLIYSSCFSSSLRLRLSFMYRFGHSYVCTYVCCSTFFHFILRLLQLLFSNNSSYTAVNENKLDTARPPGQKKY